MVANNENKNKWVYSLVTFREDGHSINNPYPKIKSNNDLIKNNMVTYVFSLYSTFISANLVYLSSNVLFNSKNH